MQAKCYRATCRLVDQLCPHGRGKRQLFSDAAIVKVYFFATHSDRPVVWACEADNWKEQLLLDIVGGNLPNQSTLSRRLRTVGVLQLIERVQSQLSDTLRQHQPRSSIVKAIDSKPLRVSAYSKDRDARRGRAAGDYARGYKVHAITVGQAFVHWTLTAMNTNDQVGAAGLLPRLGIDLEQNQQDRLGFGYIRGDNGYDANPVYRLCASLNHQLLAPPRPSNAHVRDTKRNCPQRIRSLDLFADPLRHCGTPSPFTTSIIQSRGQIERNFGNATMHGLSSPPPWVRKPHRMATWTAANLIQTMARQLQIAGVMA